jgi:hypothetical protein
MKEVRSIVITSDDTETIFIEPIIPAGGEKNCLKRERDLPFLEMRCNIFEVICFNRREEL